MRKLISLLCIISILLIGLSVNITAEEPNVLYEDYNLAKSSIIIAASNNQVLKEENSKIRLHMASMTKVMSLLLIFLTQITQLQLLNLKMGIMQEQILQVHNIFHFKI